MPPACGSPHYYLLPYQHGWKCCGRTSRFENQHFAPCSVISDSILINPLLLDIKCLRCDVRRELLILLKEAGTLRVFLKHSTDSEFKRVSLNSDYFTFLFDLNTIITAPSSESFLFIGIERRWLKIITLL
jgi:hypothetical protein